VKISSLCKLALALLPFVGSASPWPNLPGPVHAAFVTPGLTGTNGTLDAQTMFTFGPGPSGGVNFAESYVEFNGTNQMLYAATNNFGNGATQGTIVARIYLTRATSQFTRIFTSSDAASITNFAILGTGSGNLLWDIRTSQTNESFYSQTGSSLTTSRWYTAGFATDGNHGQIFVDGGGVAQSTNNTGGGNAGWWMSKLTVADHIVAANFKRSTDSYSPLRIAVILIWLRKLDDAEMMAVHNILNAGGFGEP